MQKISVKTKRLSLITGGVITLILLLFMKSTNFELLEKDLNVLFLINFFTCIFFLYLYFYIYRNVYHGAYGVTSSNENIQKTIIFLNEIHPQKIVDLGSGTGKFCIITTKAGFKIDGVEINPVYYIISQVNLIINGLSQKVKISLKNFWNFNISEYDCVIVYGISFIMDELETKFKKELKQGSHVVSIYFKFKNLELIKTNGEVSLYKI